TRAVLDGDRFVVNGQKVWTSYAMIAGKCFCYVRTDRDVPKHKGISVLILDMATPGIDVRPLRNISGSTEFAEVFFTDVEVPRGGDRRLAGRADGPVLPQLLHELRQHHRRRLGGDPAQHHRPARAGPSEAVGAPWPTTRPCSTRKRTAWHGSR